MNAYERIFGKCCINFDLVMPEITIMGISNALIISFTVFIPENIPIKFAEAISKPDFPNLYSETKP